ncbi:MAG: hypothetical protein EBU88_02880 [Acidobacteria bacterium]|nr:hypothetical protein [Acidobacteriota bacterium]
MSNQLPVPASTGRTAAACVAAFILPGLGHILLGRWVRGLLLGVAISLLFVIGLLMEGHLFKPEKEWLTWFFSLLDAGLGLPYFVCFFADWGFQVTPEQAAKVTFEYGNNFLCVAGALNMLAAMDAYDIGIGRKA